MKSIGLLLVALAACDNAAPVIEAGVDAAVEAATPCGTVQASCIILHHESDGGTWTSCDEVVGYGAAAVTDYMTTCNGATGPETGTASASPCDRRGSIGGCRILNGATCETSWEYPPQSLDGGCVGATTFVAPSTP